MDFLKKIEIVSQKNLNFQFNTPVFNGSVMTYLNFSPQIIEFF